MGILVLLCFALKPLTVPQTLNSGYSLNTDSKRTTTLLLSSFNVMPIIDCKNVSIKNTDKNGKEMNVVWYSWLTQSELKNSIIKI